MENPTAYYLQAALTFHQQSTYGNYPEPRPADLWGDTATVNKEQSLAAPASGRPVDAEHLDRIWRARRSRRTRSTRLIRKTLVEALTSAMAPSSAGLRPYPSAGGCYSASAYCYVSDVQGLEPGAYRFDRLRGPCYLFSWQTASPSLARRSGAPADDRTTRGHCAGSLVPRSGHARNRRALRGTRLPVRADRSWAPGSEPGAGF